MSTEHWTKAKLDNARWAGVVAILAILAAFTVMNLWRADLRNPFEFYGDGLQHAMMIRTISEHGWVLHNPDIGAPGALDLRSFPAYDTLNVALIKLGSLIVRDPLLLLNLFFIATFPLVAVCAFLACRSFGLSVPSSIAVSLLYALLPYHFRRGVGHLFLSCYYLVPLVVILVLRVATFGSLFGDGSGNRKGQLIWIALLTIAVGCNGAYYSFFAALSLAMAALVGWWNVRNVRPFLHAGAVAAAISLVVVLNYMPTILYQRANNEKAVSIRTASESEYFGLKLSQLILPVSKHRISDFARLKARYNGNFPLVNENDLATLGLVGSIGFLYLLGWIVFRRRAADAPLVDSLATMNLLTFLFATIGGLSTFFALFVTPQIRAFNRLSVFIAFYAFLAAGRLFDRWFTTTRSRAIACSIIAVLGIADQTTTDFSHFHSDPAFARNTRYVAQLESALPRGSEVFQLPYVAFPEGGWVHEMGDYEHLRPYLHSRHLRWSFGAIKGSRGDAWQLWLLAKPLREQVDTLALANFSAIYIDRDAYPDKGKGLETALHDILLLKPIESETGRYATYALAQHRWHLRQALGSGFTRASDDARNPLLVYWRGGFNGEEREGSEYWRWCSGEGEIAIENGSTRTRTAHIELDAVTSWEKKSNLTIRSSNWNADLLVGDKPLPIRVTVTVPPGLHRISMRSDAKRALAPSDPRKLIFRVMNYSIREVSSAELRKVASR